MSSPKSQAQADYFVLESEPIEFPFRGQYAGLAVVYDMDALMTLYRRAGAGPLQKQENELVARQAALLDAEKPAEGDAAELEKIAARLVEVRDAAWLERLGGIVLRVDGAPQIDPSSPESFKAFSPLVRRWLATSAVEEALERFNGMFRRRADSNGSVPG